MNQAEFARKVGASSGRVSEWLSGKRRPSTESLRRIAEELPGLDLDRMFALTGHRPATEPIPADDPRTDIIAKVKRVRWTEERVETIGDVLDRWLAFDKRNREKGEGG